jgi:hypothetical protein
MSLISEYIASGAFNSLSISEEKSHAVPTKTTASTNPFDEEEENG